MNSFFRSLAAALFFLPALVFAETIELVTYYPSASNNSFGRTHTDRGTIGDPYSLNNPTDLPSGALWMAGPLAIGTDFSATAPPAAALHIRTGQGIRVEQGLPTGGVFNGTGYELYRGGVERMHLYYNTNMNWVELNTGSTPNASLIFVNNAGQIRMFLAGATGNVGIGTAAPVFPLEVVRNQNTTVVAGGFSNTSAGGAGVTDLRVGQDVETNNGQYGALNYYGGGTPANFQGYGNPNQVSLVAALGAVNGLTIATNANAPIKLLTNSNGVNNERMRITPTGRVGIGTTTPASALDIVGDLFVRQTDGGGNYARIRGPTDGNIGLELRSETLGGTPYIDFANDAATDFDMRFILTGNDALEINGGNVGIGGTPNYKLDVRGNLGNIPSIYSHATDGSLTRLGLQSTNRHWSISNYGTQFNPQGSFNIADETSGIVRLTIAMNGRTTLNGGLTVTGGSKDFEIPHPLKPEFRLIHSTLEGPEIAVFYRGEGRLANGKAVVKLPDYFEKLTRPEGRTAQLTARGEEPFLLSYSSIENGEMKVHGAKPDGEFSWEVKAIRADLEPLQVEEKQP